MGYRGACHVLDDNESEVESEVAKIKSNVQKRERKEIR
jgi:hypothetical protein